jgi:Leucine-rich repeat (LRR) protein
MRLFTIMLTAFLISCSTTEKQKGLFDDLADKETVEIYLSHYNLDHIPPDIGKLKAVKRLFISKDSSDGWIVYPPLSAIQQMTAVPPFQQLPTEITELTNLQKLDLYQLDLNELPDNFDKLQKLDTLNLMMNKLNVSKELGKIKALKNLKYLGIFGNKIDSVDLRELKQANPNLVVNNGTEYRL